MNVAPIQLGGGIDGTSPVSAMHPGRLRLGVNVESKPGGGYRSIEGYSKFDSSEVPGEGDILGVWYFGGLVYAFRNAVGSATANMYASTGNGWTLKKSGLAPDGHYRFTNYAFTGTQKMYGVSGTHKAFEWDATTWTDITTGMASDTPNQLATHRKHLFLAFGNSVQNSSLGDPTSWTPLTGAAEILLDNNVTGFSTLPNGALGIFTHEGTTILQGSSSTDFVATNTSEYSNNAGAYPDTIQAMGSQLRFTDTRGVTDFGAANTSSDFYDAIISHDVDKLYEGRWKNVTCSTVVKQKNQYRLFFNDGSGLIFVFNGTQVMPTRISLPRAVKHIVNTEDSNGNERIFFSSTGGYVYEMENDSRSFDGEAIHAIAEPALTDLRMASRIKRFRRVRCDLGKSGNGTLSVTPRYYMEDGLPSQPVAGLELFGSGAVLGQAVLGQAALGASPINDGRAHLAGRGEWIGLRFESNSTTTAPWELDGYTIEYLLGKQRR